MTRLDRRRLRRFGLLAGLLAPGSLPAGAAPATTVVLVRTRGGDPGRWRAAEERTRDELRVMGIGVAEVEVREVGAAIEHALAEHGARVAIQIARAGDVGGAGVWWVDPVGGELRAARIDGLATEGAGAAAVAALRAAELVRAQTQPGGEGGEEKTVLEDRSTPAGTGLAGGVGASTEAGAGDMSPSTATRDGAAVAAGIVPAAEPGARPEPGARDRSPASAATAGPGAAEASGGPLGARRGGFDPLEFVEAVPSPDRRATPPRDGGGAGDRAVGVYAGVGGGPGGAGTLIGGGLTLRWQMIRSLALQAEAHGGTSPIWLSGQGYSFRVGAAGAQAGLVFVARRDARVSWRLGLGAGAALAWALARSPDRARTSRDRVVVATLRASAQAAIRVREHLRLVLGLDVALLLPPVAVRVQGDEVARFGTPLVRGVLGLEWEWSRVRR